VSEDFLTRATPLRKHASKAERSKSKLLSANGQLSASIRSILRGRSGKLLPTLQPFGRIWYSHVLTRCISLTSGVWNSDQLTSTLDRFFGAVSHLPYLYLLCLPPSNPERTPIASVPVLGSHWVHFTTNDVQTKGRTFNSYSRSYHTVLAALNFRTFSAIYLATVKPSCTVLPSTCAFVLPCFYGASYLLALPSSSECDYIMLCVDLTKMKK
jgi:hypothetical protein